LAAEPARWTVAHIGAREHYAVPLGLHRAGKLARLFTDAYCYRGCRLLARAPGAWGRFAARRCPELPDSGVTAFNGRAVLDALRARPRTTEELFDRFLLDGGRFARSVVEALRESPLEPTHDVFLAFDTGALEALEVLKALNVVTVVDQIDPAAVQEAVLREESEKWPGWLELPGRIPARYFDRLRAEWHVAHRVVVNSEWSRQALISQGVAAEKIVLVPCGYASAVRGALRLGGDRCLSVLWLGNVSLVKGIQYLVEAARRLMQSRIRVRVVGPVGISRQAVGSAPPNVEFVGPVSRPKVGWWYDQADVFVFPTLSDGFGITQVEAMSHGLPVIATPNCGAVVRDGVDGLIVPAGDADALAAAIARLDADRPLLAEMSRQALAGVHRFSLEKTTRTLIEAVEGLRPPASSEGGRREREGGVDCAS
jgi:glycosyltransferase involved in cell wall biosynthesis